VTTHALDLALWLPPATPVIGEAIRVSGITPLASEWFTPGAGGPGGGVPEAPLDGVSYVRTNGAWSAIIDAGTF
jgi:hypothetical protein